MSGHSKWATIKRQKGVADIKRGLTFTKISNAITVAVKKGGGISDINSNFRLRLAVEEARTNNMPKVTIDRAIQRAAGRDSGGVEEVIYEGFAPGGVSIIVEAVSDNPQRTSSDIKNIFNKEGGSFGEPGSVAYQFKQLGSITLKKGDKSLDQIFELVSDSGAEDIEDADENVIIYTPPLEVAKVKDKIVEKGLEIVGLELIRKPVVLMPITDKEKLQKTVNFLHKLEELDDVQKVYSNLDGYQ
ncbi:YebC/PmpR family DNA-binding transcriptional regulator [Candidatus Roizmanbacteria bacterium]|nr:YebC/PmpR family DNA-binding transcriptional regulator [Candidatus Roizmanbacteria bacterium]